MKMTVEKFDRLSRSDDKFDNYTADFVAMFTWITEAWAQGESTLPCEWIWKNPILREMAGNDDDFIDDDVDESNYDPYLGCDIYDSCESFDSMDW